MRLLEPLEQLEEKENLLREQVKVLPEKQKKLYFQTQSKQLKDPDTYAALNWFFLGGLHHCYLGKYALFAFEIILLAIMITGFVLSHSSAYFILAALVAFELPQLFFSQKIARQHNYDVSCQIYNDIRKY